MSKSNLKVIFKFELSTDQTEALIAYACWKGLGPDHCGEALRSMIDGAVQYMNSKDVEINDFDLEIRAMIKKILVRRVVTAPDLAPCMPASEINYD